MSSIFFTSICFIINLAGSVTSLGFNNAYNDTLDCHRSDLHISIQSKQNNRHHILINGREETIEEVNNSEIEEEDQYPFISVGGIDEYIATSITLINSYRKYIRFRTSKKLYIMLCVIKT